MPIVGELTIVFLDDGPERLCLQVSEPLVFEVEVDQAISCNPGLHPVGQTLLKEGCLAGTSHADERLGFAPQEGGHSVSTHHFRERGGHCVTQLLPDGLGNLVFHED